MSDSVRPHRWQPTRLSHPWDSPGKNTGVGCHFLLQCMKVKSESEVAQVCPTLSDPMDCSPPGSPSMGFSRQEYWSGVPLPSLNMLSRLVITFLPRSKCLFISWLQSPSAVILEPPKNKVWHYFHCFPIYFPWSDGTRCHDLHVQMHSHSLMLLSWQEKLNCTGVWIHSKECWLTYRWFSEPSKLVDIIRLHVIIWDKT